MNEMISFPLYHCSFLGKKLAKKKKKRLFSMYVLFRIINVWKRCLGIFMQQAISVWCLLHRPGKQLSRNSFRNDVNLGRVVVKKLENVISAWLFAITSQAVLECQEPVAKAVAMSNGDRKAFCSPNQGKLHYVE